MRLKSHSGCQLGSYAESYFQTAEVAGTGQTLGNAVTVTGLANTGSHCAAVARRAKVEANWTGGSVGVASGKGKMVSQKEYQEKSQKSWKQGL